MHLQTKSSMCSIYIWTLILFINLNFVINVKCYKKHYTIKYNNLKVHCKFEKSFICNEWKREIQQYQIVKVSKMHQKMLNNLVAVQTCNFHTIHRN